jgi:hypothetical protein
LARAKAEEPGVTSALISATAPGGRLVGELYRFKSVVSLDRKITQLSKLHNVDRGAASAEIFDVLRYTVVFDDATYAKDTRTTLLAVIAQGHTIATVSNTWSKPGYKGINVRMLSATGQQYEVQFHTPTSWALTHQTHPIYERFRVERDPAAAKGLKDQHDRAWQNAPIPPDAETIRWPGL